MNERRSKSVLENYSGISNRDFEPLRGEFPGAERRQMLAHGVSRGYRVSKTSSPGGAAE